MPAVATRSDAVRIKVGGVEVKHLVAIGDIPGVAILRVAGKNRPGLGAIRSQGDGTLLSWRAPGSTDFGSDVLCSSDGDYLLEDGNSDKWARVRVRAAFLLPIATQSRVLIGEVFDNGVSHGDVADGISGDSESWSFFVVNDGATALSGFRVWIDPETLALPVDISIGFDDVTVFQPDNEYHANALAFGPLAPAASQEIFVVRDTPPSTDPETDLLTLIHVSWNE